MKKFAVVFPGQGSQYVGMGKESYDNFSIARQTFEEASDALGMSVEELCFENDEQALTMTENCQPAILTVSTAMYQVFQTEYKCVPFYAAGHSLGEYTALVISGALAFSDAVKIVRSRGRFMQEASTQDNLMAAVSGLYSDIVVEECRKVSVDNKVVVVSNFNSPQQSTISGDKSAVEAVVKNLEAIGATSTVLKVSAPFHSPFMQSAAEKLKAELEKYKFGDMRKCQVVSNVTGKPYESSASIIDNLTLQMTKPVQWVNTLRFLESEGVLAYLEFGPKHVMKNLVKRTITNVSTYSYDEEEDKKKLKEEFQPAQDKLRFISKCMAIAVCTRNNSDDEEAYEKGVIFPYRKVKEMYEELEAKREQPTFEQAKEALEMLKSVFRTKQTELKEQEERWKELYNEVGYQFDFDIFSAFR